MVELAAVGVWPFLSTTSKSSADKVNLTSPGAVVVVWSPQVKVKFEISDTLAGWPLYIWDE